MIKPQSSSRAARGVSPLRIADFTGRWLVYPVEEVMDVVQVAGTVAVDELALTGKHHSLERPDPRQVHVDAVIKHVEVEKGHLQQLANISATLKAAQLELSFSPN